MLFGEYTVTQGGSALALPLNAFSGSWHFEDYSEEYAEKMLEFATYAFKLSQPGFSEYELNEVINQIDIGLRFVSDIPSGYGLGSSGTFVAAFYERFFNQKENLQLSELKLQLASLESYFHGKSSGIDPLVSFLNKAVLIQGEEVRVADVNLQQSYPFNFFLAESLLNLFISKN